MSVDDRFLKFREAIWVFTDKILPKIDPILQPSLADIAWLMANHFFSPEDSQKLYFKIREIWRNRSIKQNYHVELLAIAAWKLRLFLTFSQQESAFKMFQYITKAVRHKDLDLTDNLESICLLTSESFPFPKIPEKNIEFLFNIGKAHQQLKGNLTINRLAKLMKYPKREIIPYLNQLEIVFGCWIAFQALDLYWIRAEVDINNYQNYTKLLERFKVFAHRCEAHFSSPKSPEDPNSLVMRLSVEFLYPIAQKKLLIDWAITNEIQVYYQTEQHLYQNFNILYKDPWHPQDSTELKSAGFHNSRMNSTYRIDLNESILRIIEIYLNPAVFSGQRVSELPDSFLPFYKIGAILKLQAEKAHNLANRLFQERILVPYYYSNLLHYSPDRLVEGDHGILDDEARKYLYARAERLQSLLNMKDKIFRLYIPTVSANLLTQYEYRTINRLYWEPISPIIRGDMYDFDRFSWKYPELPYIHDLF